MLDYIWLVPFLPGMAALVIGLFGKWLRTRSGYVAIAAMLGTIVVSLGCFWDILHGKGPFTQQSLRQKQRYSWISYQQSCCLWCRLLDRLFSYTQPDT
jgi:NADH:ubiquinone oxidoreductase subunit 5 (subunit L)/multisubunit Na+/H+ antiporter MnhA subunit